MPVRERKDAYLIKTQNAFEIKSVGDVKLMSFACCEELSRLRDHFKNSKEFADQVKVLLNLNKEY